MSTTKRVALVSALVATFGIPTFAAGYGTIRAGPPLSVAQMQSLSSEGPTWHSGDGSVYDSSGQRVIARVPRASDGLILPDDATNELTPAEASRITGHVDSAAGPPLTGSEEQPGNMGPNSSKGQ